MTHPSLHRNPRRALLWLALIWLAFSLIAVALAMLMRDHATAPDGNVVPMSNDSFYHARRMIDTAGERGFYQFDETIHAPQGSWVTWPYAYDYLAGHLLKLALTVSPDTQPMAILGWIPVLTIFLNMALFTGIAARLGLSTELIALAAMALALSAPMQTLHGFAIMDHHFVEMALYLASLYALMRWLEQPARRNAAILTGVILGIAPAFHTSAFVLQALMLITLGLLWLRDTLPPRDTIRAMGIALVMSSVIIVALSAPARDGQFSLETLSWWHAYVALCTALASVLLAWRACSWRQAIRLALIFAVLGLPLIGSILLGSDFLTGRILWLDQIEEMKSPLADLAAGNLREVTSGYSGLVLLLPLIAGYFAYRLWQTRHTPSLAFYVAGLFGLLMLSLQYRLVYFGLVPMIIGSVLIVSRLQRWLPRSAVALCALVLIAVALQPSLRGQVFRHYPLGLEKDYEMTYDIFPAIERICRQSPGLMIASGNDGHPVRYHSDCSVLVNNFILTAQHETKIRELLALLKLSPQQFREAMPAETEYLFVRLRGMYVFEGDRIGLRSVEALRDINPPLFMQLAESETPMEGFELLAQLRVPDARDLPMVQVYRVTAPR